MAIDLGVLKPLLEDTAVTEIMVNRFNKVFAEHNGKLRLTNIKFPSEQALVKYIGSIAAARSVSLDSESYILDTYLDDGSRVNAVLPPMAVDGASLTIRKFSQDRYTLADLVSLQALSPRCAHFIQLCIQSKLNVVISGGTSSGKTTLLNACAQLIPKDERIVTIEDTPELKLAHENWVRLEAVSNVHHRGASIKECLRNALRMRPDRIIVGECRGAETFEMLQAMNTGHDGSITTIHANSPRDCLARIESLTLSHIDLPILALRQQIVSSIDLLVQVKRDRSGERRITDVCELTGIEGNMITTQSIFVQNQMEIAEPVGLVPQLILAIQDCGLEVPTKFFDPDADFVAPR